MCLHFFYEALEHVGVRPKRAQPGVQETEGVKLLLLLHPMVAYNWLLLLLLHWRLLLFWQLLLLLENKLLAASSTSLGGKRRWLQPAKRRQHRHPLKKVPAHVHERRAVERRLHCVIAVVRSRPQLDQAVQGGEPEERR